MMSWKIHFRNHSDSCMLLTALWKLCSTSSKCKSLYIFIFNSPYR